MDTADVAELYVQRHAALGRRRREIEGRLPGAAALLRRAGTDQRQATLARTAERARDYIEMRTGRYG